MEDRGMHRERVLVREHQDIRDRLGLDDDCEIIGVRPAHDDGRRPEYWPVGPPGGAPSPLTQRYGDAPGSPEPTSWAMPYQPDSRYPAQTAEPRYERPVDGSFFVRRVEQAPPSLRHQEYPVGTENRSRATPHPPAEYNDFMRDQPHPVSHGGE